MRRENCKVCTEYGPVHEALWTLMNPTVLFLKADVEEGQATWVPGMEDSSAPRVARRHPKLDSDLFPESAFIKLAEIMSHWRRASCPLSYLLPKPPFFSLL